jgi:C1A family cysteine protease
MSNINKYGWIPQRPDHRDRLFSLSQPIALPEVVDLRSQMPPIYDQGQLGSCTANAIGAAVQFAHKKQFGQDLMPSRLFIYYNERAMEGTIRYDSGAQIRDGIKSVNKQGVCPETDWPYIISKFKTKPLKKCYSEALKDKVVQYSVVPQTLNDMKSCLASGYPIIGGFSVYQSFESDQVAKTGIVPMPGKNESQLGGHAIDIVGYDDSKQCFIIRNSWSDKWGILGYCYMPYEYWTNPGLASDFWTIRLIS